MPDILIPDGWKEIPPPGSAPGLGTVPGYTVDRRVSAAPNQTNPQADTTTGRIIGTPAQDQITIPSAAFGAPQTALPPGAPQPTAPRVENFVKHVDPAILQMGSRISLQGIKTPVEEIWGNVFNDPERKSSRNERLYQGPNGQFYDHKGDWVDSALVDKSSLRAPGSSDHTKAPEREEVVHPVYGNVTRFWNANERKWEVEEDSETGLPVRRYFASNDPFNKQMQVQNAVGNRLYQIDKEVRSTIATWQKENDSIDPSTFQKKLSDADFAKRRQEVVGAGEKAKRDIIDRAKQMSGYIDQRNYGPPKKSDAPPVDDGTSAPGLATSIIGKSNPVTDNYNPFALKNNEGFLKFPTPEAGYRAGIDNLNRYLTGKFPGLNPNSTLLDMMKIRDPIGDGDNNPEVYAGKIAKDLALPKGINTPLSELQNRTGDVARVMMRFEHPGDPYGYLRAPAVSGKRGSFVLK